MNHTKNLLWVFVVSFVLSCIGFILDWHERTPDIGQNIFDLCLMTALIFIFLAIIYSIFSLVVWAVTKAH